MSQRTGTDVLIVGGGLSGLYAARLLADAGIAFLLLEPRERLGGRIWTVGADHAPPADGFDLGPTWLTAHGVPPAVFESPYSIDTV